MFQYEATVLRVVDGDTLWLNIDLGFRVHLEIDVRLAHINAPETVQFSINGLADPAKKYIEDCLPIGAVCIVNITKAEKFGRWLGDVLFQPGAKNREEIMRNARSLNDELVQKGLAKKYEGGKR